MGYYGTIIYWSSTQKEIDIKLKQTNMVNKSHFSAVGRHPGEARTLTEQA